MNTPAESAALATGLIYHSPRCTMSKLASCICLYQARLDHLAAAFEAYSQSQINALRGFTVAGPGE